MQSINGQGSHSEKKLHLTAAVNMFQKVQLPVTTHNWSGNTHFSTIVWWLPYNRQPVSRPIWLRAQTFSPSCCRYWKNTPVDSVTSLSAPPTVFADTTVSNTRACGRSTRAREYRLISRAWPPQKLRLTFAPAVSVCLNVLSEFLAISEQK